MDKKEQIERIRLMEEKMRRAVDALSALASALDGYDEARADFRELAAYYESADWRQDFEDDEAGLLPAPDELPRGVLSEDGIFDLLELAMYHAINQAVKGFDPIARRAIAFPRMALLIMAGITGAS